MDGTNTTLPPPIHGEDILWERSIDQSMIPVYEMANFFLVKVMVLPTLEELNNKVDLQDLDAVVYSLENDWHMWVEHYISYVMIMAFGIAFAVVIPIIGCIVYCCRKHGKCGGLPDYRDKRRTKCFRWTCNILLGAFSTLVLLGIVVTFISNHFIWEQTRPSGTMQVFKTTLLSLSTYKDNTIEDLWNLKENEFDDQLKQLEIQLNNFPVEVQNNIGKETNIGALLQSFETYTESTITSIINNFYILNNTESIITLTDQLETIIQDIKENMTSALTNCTLLECEIAMEFATNLTLGANYSQVGSLEEVLHYLINVTKGEYTIYDTLNNTQEEYDKIQQVVYDGSIDSIEDMAHEAGKLAIEFEYYLNRTQNHLNYFDFISALQYLEHTLTPEIQYADDIRYNISVAINSLSLILVTLYFLGLLFGVYGERAGPGAFCCNRSNGATVLIIAVVMTFAFTWVLFLASSITLVVGGLSYTEFCHHILFTEPTVDRQILDNVMSSYLNLSVNIGTIMKHCEEDQSFYTAFQIEQTYPDLNLSLILDLSNYQFNTLVDEINDVNYTIGDLKLITEPGKHLLLGLDDIFMTTNLEGFHTQFEADITTVDLNQFASFLRNSSSSLNDSSLSEKFEQYAQWLEDTQTQYVDAISQEETILKQALFSTEEDIASFNLTVFVKDIEEAQTRIDDDIVSAAVANISSNMLTHLYKLSNSIQVTIRHDVGKCEIVYNSVWDSITSVCVQYLYPFNAFWFSHGWCIVFYIPLIIIALFLVGLYRKTEKFIELSQMTVRTSMHRRQSRTLSNTINDVARRQRPRANSDDMIELVTIKPSIKQALQRSNIEEPQIPITSTNEAFVDDEGTDDGGFKDYERIWRGVYIVGSQTDNSFPETLGSTEDRYQHYSSGQPLMWNNAQGESYF